MGVFAQRRWKQKLGQQLPGAPPAQPEPITQAQLEQALHAERIKHSHELAAMQSELEAATAPPVTVEPAAQVAAENARSPRRR